MPMTNSDVTSFGTSRNDSFTTMKQVAGVPPEVTSRFDNSLMRRVDLEVADAATTPEPVRSEGRATDSGAVSDAEYAEMLATQSAMAARMVMNELNLSEIRQLRMLRWAIDRAEAARYGADIRRMEVLAELNEDLARQVSRLVSAVTK